MNRFTKGDCVVPRFNYTYTHQSKSLTATRGLIVGKRQLTIEAILRLSNGDSLLRFKEMRGFEYDSGFFLPFVEEKLQAA